MPPLAIKKANKNLQKENSAKLIIVNGYYTFWSDDSEMLSFSIFVCMNLLFLLNTVEVRKTGETEIEFPTRKEGLEIDQLSININ